MNSLPHLNTKRLRVVVAESAGFCYGVKRAYDMAIDAVEGDDAGDRQCAKKYTLGPLIHNASVVDMLGAKGLIPLNEPERLAEVEPGRLVIRSHGVSKHVIEEAIKCGFEIVDATCPYVRRAQRAAEELVEAGYELIIVGDEGHPEVEGILGTVDGKGVVVKTPSDLVTVDALKYGVIAQTTQDRCSLERIVCRLLEAAREVRVINTICTATLSRQEGIRAIAPIVDIMIIVGDRHSANTKRLVEIAQSCGLPTHLVEGAGELSDEWLFDGARVGVSAGASTPSWIIEEVLMRMDETNRHDETPEQAEGLVQAEQLQAEQVQEAGHVEPSDPTAQAEPTAQVVHVGLSADGAGGANGAEGVDGAEGAEGAEGTATIPMVQEPSQSLQSEPPIELKTMADAQEYTDAIKSLKNGDVVEAVVVRVAQDEVMVDLGYKSEGVIPLRELSSQPLESAMGVVAVGDTITARVVRINDVEGNIVLSRRQVEQEMNWSRLVENFRENKRVKGTITAVVKGGLTVDVGVRGFLPASQVDRGFIQDLAPFVGVESEFYITEVEEKRKNVVLTRRRVLDEDSVKAREEAYEKLVPGDVITGVVKRLAAFGAFVDIGGVDGLLHLSEMSWGRPKHPSDVVSEGESLSVMVLGIDKERQRISLGLKQVLGNPWDNIAKKYPIGVLVTATITNLASFGAFAMLEDGVEGLIHISQLSNAHVKNPAEVVTPGEEVKVKVVSIDESAKRIGLSLREANPSAEAELPPNEESYRGYSTSTSSGGATIGELLGRLPRESDDDR